MSKNVSGKELSRRQLLRLSTVGATAFGARLAFPNSMVLPGEQRDDSLRHPGTNKNLYAELLQTWCDGLLAHQVTSIPDPALLGGFLCPSCVLIHGRCSDAVYPLLHMARTSGDAKYLQAAQLVYNWAEIQVSQSDGSWINDVTLEPWKGITVFRAIALGEALHRHGDLLDLATHRRWTERLALAAKFLDGYITMETGNINYPVSACYCFALCGQVLGDSHYLERAHKLVRTCLEYFTPSGLIYGEGHPVANLSPKHFRPVDLGYNVEESLPALALYSLLTNDQLVLDKTIASLRTHMEFMLPDGGWDNSWGCRNYKWTWWGSRTSDGCHSAYVLLAQYEPKFREVAQRNLELMAACTHRNLLHGGPDYFVHGDMPCIHHSFTHIKSLATVLDHNADPVPVERLSLPRDEAYGLKTFSEIGTHLAAIGEWRATVTEFDWNEPGEEGGHVTGGALSLLFHHALGPILTASMTEYQMIEPPNQQAFRDSPHMPLTPRIECVGDRTYTSFSDFEAVLKVADSPKEISFDAQGRLLSIAHEPFPAGGVQYHIIYRLTPSTVEIIAKTNTTASPTQLRFILPVVSRTGEPVERLDLTTIRITKPKGSLIVRTDTPQGFEVVAKERTFNLVPGFECIPLAVAMHPGQEIHIRLETQPKQ